jgi:DNA gyrase subunit A
VALIRKATNPQEAQEQLIDKYSFTIVQAKAILEMRLQRLTGLEREKIISEYQDTMKMIEGLKSILSDEKKVLKIIDDELVELNKDFGDKRKTEFMDEQDEVTAEDLISDESMVVTVTFSGYIKRLPSDSYRAQKRGGKGITGIAAKAEDFIQNMFVASTKDQILCFTDLGRLYWLKVHKIPEAGRAAKGKPIVNLLNLNTQERVKAVIPIKEFTEGSFVVMVTKNGVIKKTDLMNFSRPKKNGIMAATVEEKDEVVDARITDGKSQIILVTKLGQSIRFDEEGLRSVGRAAIGVIGMRLDAGDEVVGMEIVDPASTTTQILTVTEKGYGKRTPLEEYRTQGRGGTGVITMKITDKNGPIVAVRQVQNDDEIMIASDQGKVIRTTVAEISEVGRNAQGVKLISLEDNEKVGAVAKIVDKEEEDGTPPGNA